MTNNELVANNNGELQTNTDVVMSLQQELSRGGADTYISMDLATATPLQKAKISNMLNQPDKRIGDEINKTINVVDMILHRVKLVDENTGMETDAVRIILIDDQDVSYVSVSKGIYQVLSNNIIPMFGQPPYAGGIPLTIKQGGSGTRKYLTLLLDVSEMEKRSK